MAKDKCINCNAKPGKRRCLIKNMEQICPVCCAKIRNEDCSECQYYQISESFHIKKQEKGTSSASSYFGSPVMQKSIMEASMDLMNSHSKIGSEFDNNPDKFINESFEFFNTEEFSEFSFSDEEIDLIIKKYGEPVSEDGWFHTEDGTNYYNNAVLFIMNDRRYREFSKKIMTIFLKYYTKQEIDKAWLILSTSNRLMEAQFVLPFTILMFFRGISRWKLERKV
ncbi:MAG: hypothetical protein KKD38_03500 [Candidatus Delongbacteria bacterium]|nr:hypothetical protein [Candidatus Delongbacteria bacterium]MCG2761255.1 hypothetical protein [Candidatus Delongbacteria bacterium]